MLEELAELLLPFVGSLPINVNDRVDSKCLMIIDLPTTPYIAHGEHRKKTNSSIEFSIFEEHNIAINTINLLFNNITKTFFESENYCYQFYYPDTNPSNREIESDNLWQYYFSVNCTITRK